MRAEQRCASLRLARKLFRSDCNGSTKENRCGSQHGKFCRDAPHLARGVEDRGRTWWKAYICPWGSDFGPTACVSCDKSQSQGIPDLRWQATRSCACVGSPSSKALEVHLSQSAFGICSGVIPGSRLLRIADGSESGESFGGAVSHSLAPHAKSIPHSIRNFISI